MVKGRRLGNSRATVGGLSVAVTQVSQRELSLDPPNFPDGFFDTATCAEGDMRTSKLLPTSANVTIKSDDTQCEDTFGLAILVHPDDEKDECSDPP